MISGKHDGNSHVETVRDKVYQKLLLTQTGALRRATKVAPNETARQIALAGPASTHSLSLVTYV
jgi:hypothetical protein